MQHARRVRETVEVLSQAFRRPGGHVGIEEEAAEFLARPENLLTAVTVPARVAGGQVEELQRSLKGTFEPAPLASLVEPDGALHLAPHVPELLYEFQAVPGARGGPFVERSGHVRQITLLSAGDGGRDHPSGSQLIDSWLPG